MSTSPVNTPTAAGDMVIAHKGMVMLAYGMKGLAALLFTFAGINLIHNIITYVG